MTDSPRCAPKVLVLVVEDDESLLRVARHNLEQAGYEVALARDGEHALELFLERGPDAVLSDVRMPGATGTELLEEIRRRSPETPVILMTGHATVRDAVSAIKRGATDYFTKPVDWEEVEIILRRALELRRLQEENVRLREQLRERTRFENLVGESEPMRALFETMQRLTHVESTVLLQGESGTGKELVARALHYQGARSSGPFVPVNCGAIPRELIESHLFGHERGAFTGAVRSNRGAFEQADAGTLFLDEVAEIPVEAQPALLRALSERTIQRVGGEVSVSVDVRVIAATNRDLEAAVADGDFREDLYYRLAVVPLRLPPLRERGDDVILIARELLAEFGHPEVRLTRDAEAALASQHWRGNVRELRNALERALVLRKSPEVIDTDDLPESVERQPSALDGLLRGSFPAAGVDLAGLERECIRRALEASDGNQTHAARLLGISRQTLIYRMSKYNLR